jgi:hypothetical protein
VARPFAGLFALWWSATAVLAAQGPALSVTIDGAAPRVRATALLADSRFPDLMRSGLPLRLHYRLELWRVRSNWFDQFASDAAWDAVVRHDPLADDFVLYRSGGAVSRYATAEKLDSALSIPYSVRLFTKGPGKFYYLSRLEISTLNDTDLDELTRWLKGEVAPAVSGEGSLGDALARGAQRVLVRIAGLPRLTLEARSTTFEKSR